MHNTTQSIFSKAIFWIIFLLITCFMLSLLLDIGINIHTAIKLKKHGVETIATISEYNPQNVRVSKFWQKYRQTETRHIHVITYDGFTNTIELDHQHTITSRIPVIYDKDDPSVVWINTIPRSSWKLIFTNMNIIGFTKGDILNILIYTGLGVVVFFILVKTYFKDDSL